MKSLMRLIVFLILISVAVPAGADEMVMVSRELLEKVREHLLYMQSLCETMAGELTDKELEISALKNQVERMKGNTRGLWVGAGAGLPFPTITGMAGYQFGSRFGLWLNTGYNDGFIIQAGFATRIAK